MPVPSHRPRRSVPLPESWPALIAWMVSASRQEWLRAIITVVVIALLLIVLVFIGLVLHVIGPVPLVSGN